MSTAVKNQEELSISPEDNLFYIWQYELHRRIQPSLEDDTRLTVLKKKNEAVYLVGIWDTKMSPEFHLKNIGARLGLPDLDKDGGIFV